MAHNHPYIRSTRGKYVVLNGAYWRRHKSSHCWLLSDIRWPPWSYLPVTAIITGLIRLILQDRSPWKVRSVAFDSFIGIALGIGLLITYFSFFGLFGNIFFR